MVLRAIKRYYDSGKAYYEANAWELFAAIGVPLQTLFYLAFPSFFKDVPAARAYSEPLDGIVSAFAILAGGLMLVGLVRHRLSLRVAGLWLLIGTFLMRTVASGVVYNWHVAVYGLPISMIFVGPALIRIRRIIRSGDYPPVVVMVVPAQAPAPVLERREL